MNINHKRLANFIKAQIDKICNSAVFTPEALEDTLVNSIKPLVGSAAFKIGNMHYDNDKINFSVLLQPNKPIEFVTLNCTILNDILPYKAYFIKKNNENCWVTCTDRDVSSPDYSPYVVVFGRTVGDWAIYNKSLEITYFTPYWVETDQKPDIDGIDLTTRNIMLKSNVETE